jgi:hypothetical protein
MRIKGSPPFSILLSAIALLAALLRLWGPLADAQVRHPDEFHFVYWHPTFSVAISIRNIP